MLEIDSIDVYYGDLQALWGVSLMIEEGEIVALIGSNGAGKSTTLKTVSGLLKPRSGSIRYNGIRLDRLPAHRVVELGVCMVPEGRRLFPQMSVLENLEVGAYLGQARRWRNETLKWVYDVFPILEKRADQPAGTLSGGEQQMVAIGRALMSRPKLLLIDEMSLGLAPLLVQNLSRVVKEVSKATGISVFLVEQNVRMALTMAERAYVVENGRIVRQGDARVLLNSEDVREAYLGVGAARRDG